MLNTFWFPLLKMLDSTAVLLYILVWGFPCLWDGPGACVKSGERAGKWKGFPQLHAYLISSSQIFFYYCSWQLLLRFASFFSSRVNCSFYFKIGACRHGDRCSRLHNKPTFSQVRAIFSCSRHFISQHRKGKNIFCVFESILYLNDSFCSLQPFVIFLFS